MRNASARILFIEDEAAIRDAVRAALADVGYLVRDQADGAALRNLAEAFRPDLAILDITLPGPDGLALARVLRAGSDLPILFLTARDGLEDRLAGFGAGADDYLVKPFALAELLARVQALLRRSGRLHSVTIEAGDLVLDESASAAWRAGRALDLTFKEFELLKFLAQHPGRVFSRAQLLQEVWGPAYGTETNYLRVYLSQLRRKLETDPARPRHLLTEPGMGYRFQPDDRDQPSPPTPKSIMH